MEIKTKFKQKVALAYFMPLLNQCGRPQTGLVQVNGNKCPAVISITVPLDFIANTPVFLPAIVKWQSEPLC